MNFSNLTSVASCITLLSKASDIYEDIQKFKEKETSGFKAASIGTRGVLLFLGLLELVHTSRNIKMTEFFIRVIDVPVEFCEGLELILDVQLSTAQKIAVVEKKMLGPTVSFHRSLLESKLEAQKWQRDLPPEEQANLRFPIYESNEDENKIVGYRRFDLKKCLEKIESLENTIPKIKIVELSCQIAPVSLITSGVPVVVEYSSNKVEAFTIFKIKKCLRFGEGAGSGFVGKFLNQNIFNQAVREYREEMEREFISLGATISKNPSSPLNIFPKEIALHILKLRYFSQQDSIPNYDLFKSK